MAFTVAIGTPMAGYMARTGPSEGTHDELTIGAFVIECHDRQLVMLAADIAAVDAALVEEIARGAGIRRSDLLVCASHTHSGPIGVTARLHPADEARSNPKLRQAFVALSAAAIAEAGRRIEPADLLFGSVETHGLAANRNEADGPFDPTLSVLAAKRASGELVAVVVHFACHPTVLSADNRRISADFVGPMRREMDVAFGDTITLYSNGAAGDVSTRFTRQAQDFAEAERIGAALAQAAVKALGEARPLDGPITHGSRTVPLPPRALEPRSAGNESTSDTAAERRKRETKAQGAALLAKLIATGEGAIPVSLELEAWAIGKLTLVAVPGELFASLGAGIVNAAPGPTVVVGYGNGYLGYLADFEAHAHGTYEALASPFAPSAGERVVEAASALIADVQTETMTRLPRL